MPVTLETGERFREICLEGSVTIASAAELKTLLVEARSTGEPVRIRLEQATDLDVCILQLLVVAVREWKQIGASCALLGPLKDELSAAVMDAGFEALPITCYSGVLSEV